METIRATNLRKNLYQIMKGKKIYKIKNKTDEAYLIPINRIDNCKFEIDSANNAASKEAKK